MFKTVCCCCCKRRVRTVAQTPLIDVEQGYASARLASFDDPEDISQRVEERPPRGRIRFFQRLMAPFLTLWHLLIRYFFPRRAIEDTPTVSTESVVNDDELLKEIDEEISDELLKEIDKDVEALLRESALTGWIPLLKEQVEIYRKDCEAGKMATAGRAVLKYPADLILETLLLPQTHPVQKEIRPRIETFTEMRRVNQATSIQHVTYKKVFGVSHRDAYLRLHYRELEGGGYLLSTVSQESEREEGVKRLTFSAPSGWILRSRGEETEVTYIAHVDFGGSMPKFAVLQMTREMPREVERLQMQLEQHEEEIRASATQCPSVWHSCDTKFEDDVLAMETSGDS